MSDHKENKVTLLLCLITSIALLCLASILAALWRSTSYIESERILITIIPVLSGSILCVISLLLYRTNARNKIIEENRKRDNRCQQVCYDMRKEIAEIQHKLCNPTLVMQVAENKPDSVSSESTQENSDE